MDWTEIYGRLTRDTNDAAAWATLERRVWAWARAALATRGAHVVEEAIADTLAAVAVSLERAYGPETFAGFVYGLFLTVRRRLLRENRLKTASLDGVDLPVPEDDAGPIADELGRLRRALEELPTREHRALVLRYMEQASALQIAAELNTTPGNARRVVHNGLQRLRRRLGEGGRLDTPLQSSHRGGRPG